MGRRRARETITCKCRRDAGRRRRRGRARGRGGGGAGSPPRSRTRCTSHGLDVLGGGDALAHAVQPVRARRREIELIRGTGVS